MTFAATRRQHLQFAVLLTLGSFLVLYFVGTRVIAPRVEKETRLLGADKHRLDAARAKLAAREAMDIPALRARLERAETELRALRITGRLSETPFIDARAQADVAAFQGRISRLAAASRLSIEKHSAVATTDPRLEDLVVRELDLRGRFPDLQTFADSLRALPYRIVVLSFELARDPQTPGQLRAVLRYSL